MGSLLTHPKRARIDDLRMSDEERPRYLLEEFSRCEVDRDKTRVAAALKLPRGQDSKALQLAAREDCLEYGALKFSDVLYRGTLFGELYRRQKGNHGDMTLLVPVVPLDWSAPPPPPSAGEDILSHYFLLWMTDCVAKRKPAAVEGVVLNSAGSKQQAAAFAEVIPELGPCVPQNQTLTLTRATLEAAFGEYLYRSLVPAISAPAGKAG
ncbi:hypothetical protein [Novosphingobium olei]|uniref:Uncharacterized protein n=1 Tax=Novosphingobium olei TaxID=2728851 RepID=A0A7Y0BNV8_9SPHN|nr:hypothetical protein [Novosphingobium olei]NML93658.1 hypothetical protein [Novosphingobium olei]